MSNVPTSDEIEWVKRRVVLATRLGHDKIKIKTSVVRYLFGVIDALRKAPLTPEQAEEELSKVKDSPVPEERIKEIVAHVATMSELLKSNSRLLDENIRLRAGIRDALEFVTGNRGEDCWCYDEVDGAPDSPPPGTCLACRLKIALK